MHLGVLDQALTGHFFRLRKTHDGQTGRCDIGQAAVVSGNVELTLVTSDDERHRVGRVSGVGSASFRVDHLFGITVVGGDGKDVAGFLACVVDGLDGLVGSGDGLDGSIKVSGVADLFRLTISIEPGENDQGLPYREEQSCT